MVIGIAGPYSAATEAQKKINLDAINKAAAKVYEKGHVPFVGLNMALPVLVHVSTDEEYEAIMKISLAVIDKCDALLMVGESPGANRERDILLSKGLPVYYSLDDIP